MKFTSIAVKDFKELIRDRRGLFFILLFPIFFMLIFGFAFGGTGQSNTLQNIVIVNHDQGAVTSVGEINYGDKLITVLNTTKYPNTNDKTFNITLANESQAQSLIELGTVNAGLIIPANYSKSVVSLQARSSGQSSSSANVTSTPIIEGDEGYMGFGVSQASLSVVLNAYQQDLAKEPSNINIKVQGVPGTQNYSEFDFLAPGMMVFAILLLATTVAAILTREVESGTLLRLKMSKMRSFDLLFGGLIPWSLVAGAQVVILVAVAILLGLHWQGGINSIILAIIIGIIGGVASIALAMIIASFAKNDRQAANLGTLIVVPTSFVVGAFFQLPQEYVTVFGHTFLIYNILPWTHTLDALRSVLIYGQSLSSVAYQIESSIILTLILFAIGVVLFSKTRLGAEN